MSDIDGRNVLAGEGARTRVSPALSRVPEITLIFWVIKVLTTGMGEATSDYLVHAIPPPAAVMIGAVAFAGALRLQFRAGRYVPWVYWLAVVMVAVFGTMAADALHVGLHVPYAVSTVLFAVSLAVVFVLWRRSEGTLSIHSIVTRRRECFYWATVMATFALGTAAGDFSARTLGLGWLGSSFFFAGVMAIPLIGWWRFSMNPIFAFWFAYILTRPLGASIADWLGLPPSLGGVGLGRGVVSLSLTALIALLVGYLTLRERSSRAPHPTLATGESVGETTG